MRANFTILNMLLLTVIIALATGIHLSFERERELIELAMPLNVKDRSCVYLRELPASSNMASRFQIYVPDEFATSRAVLKLTFEAPSPNGMRRYTDLDLGTLDLPAGKTGTITCSFNLVASPAPKDLKEINSNFSNNVAVSNIPLLTITTYEKETVLSRSHFPMMPAVSFADPRPLGRYVDKPATTLLEFANGEPVDVPLRTGVRFPSLPIWNGQLVDAKLRLSPESQPRSIEPAPSKIVSNGHAIDNFSARLESD